MQGFSKSQHFSNICVQPLCTTLHFPYPDPIVPALLITDSRWEEVVSDHLIQDTLSKLTWQSSAAAACLVHQAAEAM